ncbi:hypothetical protein DL766_010306 [Monosporascus sp. MC13-8B]|nr:hypothetical protein DL763_007664 [Monosporascus cannonballus]RYP02479.1 hypothetical protein DL766_010306 [Monosporascus sp. MC13-8B]
METGSGDRIVDNSILHLDQKLDQLDATVKDFSRDLNETVIGVDSHIGKFLSAIADTMENMDQRLQGMEKVQNFNNAEYQKQYIKEQLEAKIEDLERQVESQGAQLADDKKVGGSAGPDVAAGTGEEFRQLKERLEKEKARADKAEERKAIYEARIKKVAEDRDMLAQQYEAALLELEDSNRNWRDHFRESQEARDGIEAILRESIEREQERRRRLFDEVQDMKGSIRVMARIRPAPSNTPEDELMDFGQPERGEFSEHWGKLNLMTTRKGLTGDVANVKTFDFERIFGQDDTNEVVFDEVSDLAQSAVEGKKVCIFAYGQTGSGKSHTMLGDDESPGIIPRAINMIFRAAEDDAMSYRYRIELSVTEIYQDTVYDLLQEPKDGKKVTVRLHQATWETMESQTTALDTLHQASQHRSVAATNANEQSSRSHLVLAIRIAREALSGRRAGQTTTGTLNLIDLAGSERAAAAGATGKRMREGVAINSDLMNLNLVITALGSGTRVPYDSALTKALKESLTQGSRTLMLVMVSPFKKDQSQTVQTLEKGAEATRAKLASVARANKRLPALPKPAAQTGGASSSSLLALRRPTQTPSSQSSSSCGPAARTPSSTQSSFANRKRMSMSSNPGNST